MKRAKSSSDIKHDAWCDIIVVPTIYPFAMVRWVCANASAILRMTWWLNAHTSHSTTDTANSFTSIFTFVAFSLICSRFTPSDSPFLSLAPFFPLFIVILSVLVTFLDLCLSFVLMPCIWNVHFARKNGSATHMGCSVTSHRSQTKFNRFNCWNHSFFSLWKQLLRARHPGVVKNSTF